MYSSLRKYLLLPIILFFVWIVIGNFYELNCTKNDLKAIKGTIIDSKEVAVSVARKRINNGKRKELRLVLNNYPNYFRLTDSFQYLDIINSLKIGDTVTIYYRKKYLVPLGFGHETDIYQLEHNNKVLFDISKRKQNSKGIIFVAGLAVVLFSGMFLYYNWRRKIVKTSGK